MVITFFVPPKQAVLWLAVGNAWPTYSVDIESHELFSEASVLIEIAAQYYREGETKPATSLTAIVATLAINALVNVLPLKCTYLVFTFGEM